MIVSLHWDLREHLHELRKDDKNPKLRRDARLYILTYLTMRANIRLRCWPSTKTICKDTGYSQPMVVEARNWLIAHKAIVVVPFEKRIGDEEKLPVRQTVYQLTGILELACSIVPYLAMSPDMMASVISEIDAIGGEVVAIKTSLAKTLVATTKGIESGKGITEKDSAPNGAGVDLSEKITYLEPDTPPNPPTPISAPPPSPRKRNPMFDAVAEHIFKIDGDQLPDEMPDGLIGAVSAWLEGKSDGMRQGRKKLVVGKISRPAEPQHVRMFAEDWQRDHPGASMPLSFEKIVNHWRAWASKKNGARVTVPAHQPIIIPDDTELTPEEAADIKAQARKATA